MFLQLFVFLSLRGGNEMGKKVIIIGAGIGGLATAIRLLHNGYDVQIFEKNDTIGGRVNIIKTEHFCFDLSASILMIPQCYKEIFSYANRDYSKYIEFIQLDPNYRLFSSDKSIIDFSTNLANLTKSLESISTDDSLGYFKFLTDVYYKYLNASEYFLQNSQDNYEDFFNLNTIIKGISLNTFSTTYDYISKYIKDERIKNFLAFQTMYVGISPFQGPNIYTLIPAVSQLYGLWHLKGGMYSFVTALAKLVCELGGVIKTNQPVEEILFSNDKATGVRTASGIEKSDIVVCNADFPYAVKQLIKDEKYKGKYTDEKLLEMKYSCGTFIMNLGLKNRVQKLAVHNIILGDNFKEGIESAFKGVLPQNPPLYIYCPSKIDRTMASNDGECLNIIARVPNLLSKDVVWNNDTINSMEERIFMELKNIEGFQNIQDNIEYKNIITPVDMENKFNAFAGTSFGLSPTLKQTNYFRPHLKSDIAKNLFFVGNSVHPGSGISLVLNSSKIVSEEILACNINKIN